MMSLEYIRQMSREAAAEAATEGMEPFVPEPEDVEDALANPRVLCGSIPNLGDYLPPGWVRYDLQEHKNAGLFGIYMGDNEGSGAFFVDASGMGGPGEPAMTATDFVKAVSELPRGLGYAIVEVGQFQVKVGVFEREDGDASPNRETLQERKRAATIRKLDAYALRVEKQAAEGLTGPEQRRLLGMPGPDARRHQAPPPTPRRGLRRALARGEGPAGGRQASDRGLREAGAEGDGPHRAGLHREAAVRSYRMRQTEFRRLLIVVAGLFLVLNLYLALHGDARGLGVALFLSGAMYLFYMKWYAAPIVCQVKGPDGEACALSKDHEGDHLLQ